jgi:ribosomal-protein-alanine N-acetyltransferase
MSNTTDTIEFASGADAPSIALLSRDEIEHGLVWSWTPRRVQHAIRDAETNVVVVKEGAVLCGFGIMQYGEEGAYLNLLAVSQRYRRHGLATRIVNWLECVAITAGLIELSVQLRETNIAARALYTGLGFELIDRIPGYYQNTEVALVMAKSLEITNPQLS